MMRRFINAVRLYEAAPPNLHALPNNPKFLKAVLRHLDNEGLDSLVDYTTARDPEFAKQVSLVLSKILAARELFLDDGRLVISRGETRPIAHISDMTSVGRHWAWDEAAAYTRYDDFAKEEWRRHGHSPKELVEFSMYGYALPTAVNWPATVAQNWALPGEHEITLRHGASIYIEEAFVKNGPVVPIGRDVRVDALDDIKDPVFEAPGHTRRSLRESYRINGHPIYENVSFDQLIGLVNRYGEMKGQLLGSDLTVWDARHLTHYDYVRDMGALSDYDEDDDGASLPGYSYSFTPEGQDATSEWNGMPFVEGGGLRIYVNSDFSLKEKPIMQFRRRMGLNEAAAPNTPASMLRARVEAMNLPAKVSIYPKDSNTAEVTDLEARVIGQGQGRATMQAVIALADELGVTLELWPVSDDQFDGLDQEQLYAWYDRLGFRSIPNREQGERPDFETDRYLVRQPKIGEARKPTLKPKLRPTAEDIDAIRKIRHEIRCSEGSGGMCSEVAYWITNKFGWEQGGGIVVDENGDQMIDHVWNILPDGAILDSTADQMGRGHDIRIIEPGDPDHARYRLEWFSDYHPGHPDHPELADTPWSGEFDWDAIARLRKERGAEWHVTNRDQYREYQRQERLYATGKADEADYTFTGKNRRKR